MSNFSEQSSSDLLTLARDCFDKLEKHVGLVTKSVNDAEKMREYFLDEKRKLAHPIVLVLKALVPFIPIVFLIGLFFLPCGINFDGFGVKFSTTACVMKK